MKYFRNYILVVLTIFAFYSCSSDEYSSYKDLLIGKWGIGTGHSAKSKEDFECYKKSTLTFKSDNTAIWTERHLQSNGDCTYTDDILKWDLKGNILEINDRKRGKISFTNNNNTLEIISFEDDKKITWNKIR